ncbi:hypothetical protein [Corynebacterium pacaense]|uniref:hypothetical protein n=1 Tax=Corynebacterium pacaense TaxID=1816684 RepID=UPI0009BBDFAF|nr:hypothetical protein [Corynebacterium pacaense]
MSNEIYVRTTIEIPGAPAVIHLAEMTPLIDAPDSAPAMCALARIIELSGDEKGETITGAGRIPGPSRGLAAEPNEVVPHPDSYADFPDISSEMITSDVFEGLWLEAAAKFPEVTD